MFFCWLIQDRRRIGRAIVLTGVAALTARLVWGNLPIDPLPSPAATPSPNAYEDYARAGLMVDSDWKRIYTIGHSLAEGERPVDADDWVQAQTLVEKHADALATLRLGMGKEYLYPDLSPDNWRSSSGTRYKALAHLLVLQGKLKLRAGDSHGALQCYLDTVHLGESISHGDWMIGYLTARSIEREGLRAIDEEIANLSSADAEAAVHTLAETADRHASLVEALTTQKRFQQQYAVGLMEKPGYWFEAALWPRRTVMHNVTAAMDAQIELAKHPYDRKAIPIPQHSDWMSNLLTPDFTYMSFVEASSAARRCLTTTALAIKAYQAEHGGTSPASLSELVPQYLPAVPADPFQSAKPLGYLQRDGQRVLYSIGPDGVDNGGTAIDNPPTPQYPKRDKKTRHQLLRTSEGDIVYGINR